MIEQSASSTSAQAREPSWLQLVIYGLPALPLALLTLPFYVLVPSYYTSVGIPIAVVGNILLLVRLFDAFSDPVAGYLSDRTRTRFGRRKIWFALGIPITAFAAYMVFSPPDVISWQYLLIWSLMLSLGWTIALVPFAAWGAELSPSYNGRNRVSYVREGFAFVGTLAALILQFAIGEIEATLDFFARFIAIALPIAAVLTLILLPEPIDRSVKKNGFLDGLAFMRNNMPFRRLVLAYLINGLANGLPVTLFLMFVSDKLQLAEKAGLFLVVYFMSGLVGMPFWMQIAKLTSKHRSWCYAMLLTSVVFLPAPFIPAKADALFLIICICTGFSVGADLVLPTSLQSDVIDIDTAASGEQRSGIYLAIWGLATKLSLALAVGLAFPLLAYMGYDPGSGKMTESGLMTLGLLYAALPVFLKLCAVALMWNFPMDEMRQKELREAIEKRLS
jgi:glycoside/pentoside/hexuronide:cation symporter, GPH family